MNIEAIEQLYNHFTQAIKDRKPLDLEITGENGNSVRIYTHDEFDGIVLRSDEPVNSLINKTKNKTSLPKGFGLDEFIFWYGHSFGQVEVIQVKKIFGSLVAGENNHKRIRVHRTSEKGFFYGYFGTDDSELDKRSASGEVAKGEDPEQMICDLIQKAKEGKRYAGGAGE